MAFGDLHRALQPPTPVFGHLFSGRYKSLPVDHSGNGYCQTVCDYVHLNPVRARRLRPDQPLRRETTLPLQWICRRLKMGSCKSINQRLYEQRHSGREKDKM